MSGTLIVLCFLYSIANLATVEDLADDAKKALEELKTMVENDTTEGFSTISDFNTMFITNGTAIFERRVLDFELQYSYMTTELIDIQALADKNGVNISSCMDTNKIALSNVKQKFNRDMREEETQTAIEKNTLLKESNSSIALTLDTVAEIEENLNVCDTDVCFTTIIDEIEQNKIQLPENINNTLESTGTSIGTILEQFKNKTDDVYYGYVLECAAMMGDIIACVYQIVNTTTIAP